MKRTLFLGSALLVSLNSFAFDEYPAGLSVREMIAKGGTIFFNRKIEVQGHDKTGAAQFIHSIYYQGDLVIDEADFPRNPNLNSKELYCTVAYKTTHFLSATDLRGSEGYKVTIEPGFFMSVAQAASYATQIPTFITTGDATQKYSAQIFIVGITDKISSYSGEIVGDPDSPIDSITCFDGEKPEKKEYTVGDLKKTFGGLISFGPTPDFHRKVGPTWRDANQIKITSSGDLLIKTFEDRNRIPFLDVFFKDNSVALVSHGAHVSSKKTYFEMDEELIKRRIKLALHKHGFLHDAAEQNINQLWENLSLAYSQNAKNGNDQQPLAWKALQKKANGDFPTEVLYNKSK